MLLVGYKGDSACYRLYDPATKRVSEARDVTFNEKQSLSVSVSDSGVSLLGILGNEDEKKGEAEPMDESAATKDENQEDVDGENDELSDAGSSTMKKIQPSVAQRRQLRDRESIKLPARYQANFAEWETPNSFEEAVSGKNAEKWREAIQEELQAHEQNKMWTLVPARKGRTPIDYKWVFKIQRTASGDVSRFKARLCARGFLQKPGLDYSETFSPVVRYDSLRILLALVAHEDLEMTQFDVKTAFLHGKLKEDIFMKIPEDLDVTSELKESVCKLQKSLYGLKQASRCWNEKFSSFLKQFDFSESEADKCVFRGRIKSHDVYLALYVDDGVIASKSKLSLECVIRALQSAYDIMLGDMSVFAGMQIERNRAEKSIFLHQRAYLESVIKKFNLNDARTVSVPADPQSCLQPANEEKNCQAKIPYRKAVGSLMFLTVVCRPNIAFAVNAVSRYLSNFNNSHWEAQITVRSNSIFESLIAISLRAEIIFDRRKSSELVSINLTMTTQLTISTLIKIFRTPVIFALSVVT